MWDLQLKVQLCRINNILLHSQCTVTKTSLVAGFSTPLSAVHLKYPWSRLLMTRGKVTTLLLETLVHVMRGSGFPTAASQFRVTLSASVTLWLPDILVMAGGTEKKVRPWVNMLQDWSRSCSRSRLHRAKQPNFFPPPLWCAVSQMFNFGLLVFSATGPKGG